MDSNDLHLITTDEAISQIRQTLRAILQRFCDAIEIPDKNHVKTTIDEMKNRACVEIIVSTIWAGNSFITLETVPIDFSYAHSTGVNPLASFMPDTLIDMVTDRNLVRHSQFVPINEVWTRVHEVYEKLFKQQYEYMFEAVLRASIDTLERVTPGEKKLLKTELNDILIEADTRSFDIFDDSPNPMQSVAFKTFVTISAYAEETSTDYRPVIDEWNRLGREIFKKCNYVSLLIHFLLCRIL